MAEPTEEEFPAEPAEGEVTAVDEEMLQPEEEPVATGAPPVPKTDEEVLTGVYHHLANFYGGVDAAIVNEMLTAPTKCAFLRIVGPAAVAGRLMGGKAAKAAAAKLLASKHGKAAELPVRYFIRFVKPLPRLKSSYCGIVSYNFREQSTCDAFLQQYASQAGGFTFAAETDGCNQIKLLKAVAKVGAENNVLSRLALYEEWDSADSALLCGVHRADKELLQKHLGFDAGSGKLMALQGERAAVEGFSLLAEDHVPGATSEAALLSYYDFEELSACDAWLAHYLADEDGFRFAVTFEGCNCLKLRRSLDTPTKVMFYEEWTDQWAAKKLEGVRDESGYLSRWFGGGEESTADAVEGAVRAPVKAGKWSKLKGEAVEVQTYAVPAMHLTYATSVLASTVPVRKRTDRSAWEPGPQPHYSLPIYK